MIDANVIYTGKTKTGKEIIFRYPTINDVEIMRNFINKMSLEKTFITFQGEQQTLEQEKGYLESELDKIKNNKCVYLLAFINNKLVGSTAIGIEDKVRSHIGVFGITVDKDFRGEGIGKLLLENILKEAEKLENLKIIILEVYSANILARGLYKKFGFQEYGRLPKGIKYKDEYIDSILMFRKNLLSSKEEVQ